MLSSRIIAGLLLLLAIAGCGYTPAFGPGGPASSLRTQVAMAPPSNQNAFELVKQLERRLGHTDTPGYQLSYQISTYAQGIGVTPGQEIVRFNLVGTAQYTLTDMVSGAVLTSGTVDSFTGYSVDAVNATTTPPRTSGTISSLAAKRDAATRLMVILADQIVTRLIASTPGWAR